MKKQPITSPQGLITVPVTTSGEHYVLGPYRLPEHRNWAMIEELHQQRLTRSMPKALEWAQEAEQWLLRHCRGLGQ